MSSKTDFVWKLLIGEVEIVIDDDEREELVLDSICLSDDEHE